MRAQITDISAVADENLIFPFWEMYPSGLLSLFLSTMYLLFLSKIIDTAGIDQCSTQKHAQNIENTDIKLPNKEIISMFLACFTHVLGQNIGHCLQWYV